MSTCDHYHDERNNDGFDGDDGDDGGDGGDGDDNDGNDLLVASLQPACPIPTSFKTSRGDLCFCVMSCRAFVM